VPLYRCTYEPFFNKWKDIFCVFAGKVRETDASGKIASVEHQYLPQTGV